MWILRLAILLFFPTLVWAGLTANPETGRLDRCITVEEADGSPSMQGCQTLKVTNTTLTDNADGTFTVTTGGGGGNSFETIAVPAGANTVADSSTDTLTLTETTFLTLTGTAATDTIDITQVTTDLGTDGLIAADAVALATDTTGAYVAGITGGAGITSTGGGAENATVTLTTDSTEAAFLAAGALTCGASTAGKAQIHTTPLQYCDNAATPALQYAAYGSSTGVATSATILATARTIGGTSFDGSANIAIGALTSTNVGATTSLEFLGVISNETGTGALTFATDPVFSTSVQIPNGTAPTVDAAGEVAVDTTDDQFSYFGGAKRTVSYKHRKCGLFENLVAADDNILFFNFQNAGTVVAVSCRSSGFTTQPVIQFEDDVTPTSIGAPTAVTCDATSGTAWTAISSNNAFVAGEAIRFDNTAASAPITGTQALICLAYTDDAQ